MLSSALPELQNSIQIALQTALTQAQMTLHMPGDDSLNSSMRTYMLSLANMYSTTAATIAAPLIADAIYKFVLQIGIDAAPLKLKTTQGPVTGEINQTEFKIS